MSYSPETCDQLIEVLKYIPKDEYEKIPREVISDLYSNCNSESTFVYNQALSLEEQGLSDETLAALREFSEKYWKAAD